MIIHIGWWIVPTLITLGVIAYGFLPAKMNGLYGAEMAGAFEMMVAITFCMASWLAWSLLA